MSAPRLAIEQRTAILFGSSGQLGQAILKELEKSGSGYVEVKKISWQDIGQTSASESGEALLKRILGTAPGRYDFLFASGLTDPGKSERDLKYSNFEFPTKIMAAVLSAPELAGSRMMTFGSIHERFEELLEKNAYLRSKLNLALWIQGSSQGLGKNRVLHLRLHTLYGGKPNPRMFLGQMATRIKEQNSFEMSSGEQLREYMHVEDFAEAVKAILSQSWDFGPILEINSGEAVRLADLARAVFKALNSTQLLHLGVLNKPSGENQDQIFPRTEPRFLPRTRKTIPAVIEYVKSLVG